MREDQRVPSQCLCFSGLSASPSSVRMTASGFGTVRLLLKNILYRQAAYDHSSDKSSVSKEPVCRSIVVSGRRKPSDSQHSGLSPSRTATRSFSFSYGIRRPPWPGARIGKCIDVESRSSGGGHRSPLGTFRTPPAVEAHVLREAR